MVWKAENYLIFSIFGRKMALSEKFGKIRVCHVAYYHSLSISKKIPQFHSFLSVGTVVSPSSLITRPLCIGSKFSLYKNAWKITPPKHSCFFSKFFFKYIRIGQKNNRKYFVHLMCTILPRDIQTVMSPDEIWNTVKPLIISSP